MLSQVRDMELWRHGTILVLADVRSVLFGHVGVGESDLLAYGGPEVRLGSRGFGASPDGVQWNGARR